MEEDPRWLPRGVSPGDHRGLCSALRRGREPRRLRRSPRDLRAWSRDGVTRRALHLARGRQTRPSTPIRALGALLRDAGVGRSIRRRLQAAVDLSVGTLQSDFLRARHSVTGRRRLGCGIRVRRRGRWIDLLAATRRQGTHDQDREELHEVNPTGSPTHVPPTRQASCPPRSARDRRRNVRDHDDRLILTPDPRPNRCDTFGPWRARRRIQLPTR